MAGTISSWYFLWKHYESLNSNFIYRGKMCVTKVKVSCLWLMLNAALHSWYVKEMLREEFWMLPFMRYITYGEFVSFLLTI